MGGSALLHRALPPCPAKAELRGESSPNAQPRWLTEVVSCTLHHERGTVKRVAADLGVREGAVYDVADINGPKPLKAAWIPTICEVTGSFAILDAIEARVGRVAFKLPAVNPHADAMTQELAREARLFADFLHEAADDLADGRLQPHEVKPLLHAIDRLVAGLAQFRARVVRKAAEDAR